MINNKEKYIEHINDNSQILVMRKVLDKVERVLDYHKVEYTDFLDPYQRRLCYSFLNRFLEIKYFEEGGYNNSERKSIVIFPHYLTKYNIDNPVKVLKVKYSSDYTDLNHRDYLGALMSLGIKREKVGDIIVSENFGEIILLDEIKDFVLFSLDSIAKERVEVNEIALSDIVKPKVETKEIYTTVASLRADNIISSAHNISRSDSSTYVKSKKVKVNWEPITEPSYEINEGDMISLKKKGRVIVKKVLGLSRKGRIKLILEKLL
ncbi:MAG: RNA-binding protein [Firmicutes bacterium]|nr:RNA-binding protein [Bacillota bacterium]